MSGVESCRAICTPAAALVAPGRLAAGFRHDRGSAFLPANGDGDIAVVESIERREIALPGHTKHVSHPVNDELVDQNFGGRPCAVIGAHHASPVACRSLYIMPQARAGSKIASPRWRTAATPRDRRALSANGNDRSLAHPHPHVAGSTETTSKGCI